MHRVVIVAFDGVVPSDLSAPADLFDRVRLANGRKAYEVRVCGVKREVDAGPFRVKVRHGLRELGRAHTVILPGIFDITRTVPDALVRAVTRAARSGARIASVCTGAFVLAATGLLDGRRATTHWLAAAELARRFPRIAVDPNVLYVDEGRVLTSAGATAAVDLCLHVVSLDYGAAVAAAAARLSVMPLRREGGQSQFIDAPTPSADEVSMSRLLEWMEGRLGDDSLCLAAMARRAAMSVRTLSRRFREHTGTTPLHWLHHARIRRARALLETTPMSVDRIASSVGFGSVASFRVHFRRVVGTSALAYRRAFRVRAPRSILPPRAH